MAVRPRASGSSCSAPHPPAGAVDANVSSLPNQEWLSVLEPRCRCADHSLLAPVWSLLALVIPALLSYCFQILRLHAESPTKREQMPSETFGPPVSGARCYKRTNKSWHMSSYSVLLSSCLRSFSQAHLPTASDSCSTSLVFSW